MTDLIRDGNWFEAGLKVDPVRMVRLVEHAGLTGREEAIPRGTIPVPHPWGAEGAVLIRGSDCWWSITYRLRRGDWGGGEIEIKLYRLGHDPTECRPAQCVCPPCEDTDAECDDCSCCTGTCWEDHNCHECAGEDHCDTHDIIHEFTPEEVA